MNLAINLAVNPWIAAAVFAAPLRSPTRPIRVLQRRGRRPPSHPGGELEAPVGYMLSAFSVISYTENPGRDRRYSPPWVRGSAPTRR